MNTETTTETLESAANETKVSSPIINLLSEESSESDQAGGCCGGSCHV